MCYIIRGLGMKGRRDKLTRQKIWGKKEVRGMKGNKRVEDGRGGDGGGGNKGLVVVAHSYCWSLCVSTSSSSENILHH